jgi:hypothetical protein
MSADFPSWSHDNLARFAAESQAEIVALNNRHAATLVVLKALTEEHARVCDMFCCKPERNDAYKNAMEVLK